MPPDAGLYLRLGRFLSSRARVGLFLLSAVGTDRRQIALAKQTGIGALVRVQYEILFNLLRLRAHRSATAQNLHQLN